MKGSKYDIPSLAYLGGGGGSALARGLHGSEERQVQQERQALQPLHARSRSQRSMQPAQAGEYLRY